MKDSTKLFLSSIAIIFAGYLRGSAPTTVGKEFDSSSFLRICAVAVIVAVLGLIKYIRGR